MIESAQDLHHPPKAVVQTRDATNSYAALPKGAELWSLVLVRFLTWWYYITVLFQQQQMTALMLVETKPGVGCTKDRSVAVRLLLDAP